MTIPPVRKALIVTGGSRGIGAATARLAAERGFAVCVNYRANRAAADAVVAAIAAAGGTAIAVGADVASEPEVVRLFATVDRALGPLGALVAPRPKRFERHQKEDDETDDDRHSWFQPFTAKALRTLQRRDRSLCGDAAIPCMRDHCAEDPRCDARADGGSADRARRGDHRPQRAIESPFAAELARAG